MSQPSENPIARMVYDDWKSGRQRMNTLIEQCKEWDRQWEGVMPPKNFPWKNCSNLNVPITSSIGDTLLAHMVRLLLGQRPLIRVKPRSDASRRNARIMEAVIDDQAYNDSNLFQSLVEAFHDGLRYGVWAVIVDWEEYDLNIPSRIAVPHTGETEGQVIFEEQTVYRTRKISRPKIVPQNVTEIVVSPEATCINRDGVGNPADYVIFRRCFKHDDLVRHSEENGGVYFNIGLLSPSPQKVAVDEVLKEKEARLGIDRSHVKSYDYEGFEGWYWYDINNDGKQELCVFTVVIVDDAPILVRMQECPYRHYKIPLIWQKLFPERGLYSKSVPAWLKDIQDEINTIHNQRRDAVSLSLLKMWKYRLGSRFDVNQELYPGCMIGVMDMQDFDPVVSYEQGIIPAINEEQLLNDYIEKMTGITDYAIGRESALNPNPTAAGTLALIQNSNLRIDLIAKYWRNCGLRELGEYLGELNQQFYPVESYLEPFDPAGFSDDLDQGMLRVLISDLEGDFKYEYLGNSYAIDKNAERQQSVFLYDLLQNNPLVKDNPKTLYDLTRDILATFGKNDIRISHPDDMEREHFNTLKQLVSEASIENRLAFIEALRGHLAQREDILPPEPKDLRMSKKIRSRSKIDNKENSI